MHVRSIRAKLDDVMIVNGVAVFLTNTNKRILKIAGELRKNGYRSAHVLRSISERNEKINPPIAMSINDAIRLFDSLSLENKMTRPNFEAVKNFFDKINKNSVITSIYDGSMTRNVKARAYLFWLNDILNNIPNVTMNYTKSYIVLDGLEKYVNQSQIRKPYAFLVDLKPSHEPPKAFEYETHTLEDGKKIRIHKNLNKYAGKDFNSAGSIEEVENMEDVEREIFLHLNKLLFSAKQ